MLTEGSILVITKDEINAIATPVINPENRRIGRYDNIYTDLYMKQEQMIWPTPCVIALATDKE